MLKIQRLYALNALMVKCLQAMTLLNVHKNVINSAKTTIHVFLLVKLGKAFLLENKLVKNIASIVQLVATERIQASAYNVLLAITEILLVKHASVVLITRQLLILVHFQPINAVLFAKIRFLRVDGALINVPKVLIHHPMETTAKLVQQVSRFQLM